MGRRFRISERARELGRAGAAEDGFTYLGLLITLAIIAIASTATIQLGSVVQRRVAEEELLAIGMEFRAALISYANATPPGQPRSPKALQDLLKDPRYPNIRRHLRRLYADPITGKEEWGIVSALDGSGGIAGVHSLSERKPVKVGNFGSAFLGFEDAVSYQDWKFVAQSHGNPTPNHSPAGIPSNPPGLSRQ